MIQLVTHTRIETARGDSSSEVNGTTFDELSLAAAEYSVAHHLRLLKSVESLHQKYQVGDSIGYGSFATVRRGRNRETRETVAIKIIHKERMRAGAEADIVNEVELL